MFVRVEVCVFVCGCEGEIVPIGALRRCACECACLFVCECVCLCVGKREKFYRLGCSEGVHIGVLQDVVECCSVLQCVALCCSVLHAAI